MSGDATMNKPKVGDEVIFVSSRGRAGRDPIPAVVRKVGRKWATAETLGVYAREERFDLETWAADGGGFASPGQFYRDLDEYRAKVEAEQLWDMFRRDVARSYVCPPGVTAEKIRRIGAILEGREIAETGAPPHNQQS